MPGRKGSCHAVVLRSFLVVAGGHDGSEPCRRVFAFDTKTQNWDEWEPTPHVLCAVASDGSQLIVAGGCPLVVEKLVETFSD